MCRCPVCVFARGFAGVMSADEAQQAFLSRLLLMLGIFVIMCLLMF
jgi:hypothetical protein